MIDRRQFAKVEELAEAVVLDDIAEIRITLGAREIVGADDDRGIRHRPKVLRPQPLLIELS
jgi:hypothetical protein